MNVFATGWSEDYDGPGRRRGSAPGPERAPSGIYIINIHGTFVNFLDLSPAIQEDIIARLEASSV